MSSPESLPLGESKSPPVGVVGHEHRLHRGVLGIIDISAATMANIGPAMSFYFGFGLSRLTAGVASPLTIVAAVIAIAFLGNTLAQFSRAHPSTGGFITFVGKAFGRTSAVTTALIAGTGLHHRDLLGASPSPAASCPSPSITTSTGTSRGGPDGRFSPRRGLMMIRGICVSTQAGRASSSSSRWWCWSWCRWAR